MEGIANENEDDFFYNKKEGEEKKVGIGLTWKRETGSGSGIYSLF